MIQKEYIITCEEGFNAKPVTTLVTEASKLKCVVKLIAKGQMVDFKSIIGVMSLAVYKGEHIIIICDGEGEEEAASILNNSIKDLKLAKEL